MKNLSRDGLYLQFYVPEDEVELFYSRFPGEHVAVFINEIRTHFGQDDSFTYREIEPTGETLVFETYKKPD